MTATARAIPSRIDVPSEESSWNMWIPFRLTGSSMSRAPANPLGPGVAKQIVQPLAQANAVAEDGHPLGREFDRPLRIERASGLDRLGSDLVELEPLALERPALVEAGEQEQVIDEGAHPLALAADPAHRALEVVRTLRCAALEELGVRSHRGQRCAQLVRGVGHEAPQPAVGVLDAAEHGVQG